MGLSPFSRSSVGCFDPPNPNPSRFTIRSAQAVGSLTVAKILYPGCTTYGGIKTLVFECDPEALTGLHKIDPHFVSTTDLLIGRFPGSDRGWRMAVCFAQAWGRKK